METQTILDHLKEQFVTKTDQTSKESIKFACLKESIGQVDFVGAQEILFYLDHIIYRNNGRKKIDQNQNEMLHDLYRKTFWRIIELIRNLYKDFGSCVPLVYKIISTISIVGSEIITSSPPPGDEILSFAHVQVKHRLNEKSTPA